MKKVNKYFPALSLAASSTLIYLIAGILWIFLSDNLLDILIKNRPELTQFQTYKGLFFILATGFILFLLIAGYSNKIHTIEETFRKTIEEVIDYAIYILDEDGNILTWNKGAEIMSGYAPDEIMGKNHEVFYTPEEKAQNLAVGQLKIVRKEGKLVFEGNRIRKDGTNYYALVTTTALYNNKREVNGFLKIVYDLTERKKSEDLIIQNRQQIRNLMEHLELVREEERINIAREIHDELGQMLTSLKIDLSLLSKDTMQINNKVEERINKMKQKIDSSINTVRKISSGLRPNEIDFFGIEATIESELLSLRDSSGISVNLNSSLKEFKITDTKTSIAIYRIFKEAITNILRHSNATSITVNIFMNENSNLVLEIYDNGGGFDSDAIAHTSYGIIGMLERATILGGTLLVDSKPGLGCRVTLLVPQNRLTKNG
jgi:PAS domain S-box-containing protein